MFMRPLKTYRPPVPDPRISCKSLPLEHGFAKFFHQGEDHLIDEIRVGGCLGKCQDQQGHVWECGTHRPILRPASAGQSF